MNDLKFVLIGGGSYGWSPRIATDLFITPSLAGSRLVLVDTDDEALALMHRYLRMVATRVGTRWQVDTAEIDAALDRADGVCVSISTGGFDAMHHDYTIPERFGIYHSVGDTVGPGGISRTLRNVPVFVDISRRMERLCPDTWMVHVTNPLAQITRAVWKASEIRCVGLCHNFSGTRAMLARLLDATPPEVHAVSRGVNHFTWLSDITCRGRDVAALLNVERYLAYEASKLTPADTTSLDEQIAAATGEDSGSRYLLNFQLHERFGMFPAGAASHVAENFPHYLHSMESVKRHHVKRKGVIPARVNGKAQNRRTILDRAEGRSPLPTPERSNEGVAELMAALCAGQTVNMVVNLPNRGQIPNLPADAVVETWAHATWNSIAPVHAGPVPISILGMLQSIVSEEEIAVDAALTGDRAKVRQAMHVSPLVRDKDRADELADALLSATQRWLPQFRGPLRDSYLSANEYAGGASNR